MNPNSYQSSLSLHNIIHYPITSITNSGMYNMPHINHQIRYPNYQYQMLADKIGENLYGFGNEREEQNYFNSNCHQSFNTSKDVKVPLLDSPDPYVHYLFLESIKQTHQYLQKSDKPPYYIVSYLFGLLSLENCPYPFSVLEYIAINIPHFLLHFAPHEINFLGEILQRKYPVWVDYEKEYHKIYLIDRSQSKKLLNLVLTLTVLHSQLSTYKSQKPNMVEKSNIHILKHTEDDSENEIEWIVNYMLLLTVHFENLKSFNENEKTEEQRIEMEEGKNSLKVSRQELISLLQLNERGRLGGRLINKIAKLIYEILPKGEVMKRQDTKDVLEIVCEWEKKGGFRLFGVLEEKLTEEIGRIGKRICKEGNGLEIRTEYLNFCYKTLNILTLRQFEKCEDIKLINFISACKLLCGSSFTNRNGCKEKEHFENEYCQIIDLAFEIAKENRTVLQKEKTDYDEVLRNDEW